jgi:hypothetical protein
MSSDINIPPTIWPETKLMFTRLGSDGKPETLWLEVRVSPGTAADVPLDEGELNDRGEIFLELTSGNSVVVADRYVGWRVTKDGLDLWLDEQGSRKPRARKKAT